MVRKFPESSFDFGEETTSAEVVLVCSFCDVGEGVVIVGERNSVRRERFDVARKRRDVVLCSENASELFDGEMFEGDSDRDSADELSQETEANKIVGRLWQRRQFVFSTSLECARKDKEDVFCAECLWFVVSLAILVPESLERSQRNLEVFHEFQHALLDVSGIYAAENSFARLANFVDLVDVYRPELGRLEISVALFDQLLYDISDVLPDVSSRRKLGCITLYQGRCGQVGGRSNEVRLAAAARTPQQHVLLVKMSFKPRRILQASSRVVIVV